MDGQGKKLNRMNKGLIHVIKKKSKKNRYVNDVLKKKILNKMSSREIFRAFQFFI